MLHDLRDIFPPRDVVVNPAGAKLQGSDHVIGQDYGGQEKHFGSAQKINDVLAGAGLGFGRLVVTDEWVRDEGQGLIKQKQGDQVGREGHSRRRGQGQRRSKQSNGFERAL